MGENASDQFVRVPRRGRNVEIFYSWGVHGRNRMDTVSGTITKDLVAEPSITVGFELDDASAARIVAVADSVGFWSLPACIEPPDTLYPGIRSVRMPCSSHLLTLTLGTGRSRSIAWSTCHPDPCAERDRAAVIGALIEKIVTTSEAYRQLPATRGRYQ